jgi:hypothetical protein
MHGDVLKYYTTFVEYSNSCSTLVKASLDECYYWLVQSFEESKNIACGFEEHVNGYELSCLNDLVKASVKIDESGIKIDFRGFIFVPEHASGSEMSLFNVIYELGENGEKLYFDNPLGDPCETTDGEAINALLDTLVKIFNFIGREANW